MKKIRLGNDVKVTWAIYDKESGLPYDLAGRNITLYAGRNNTEMERVAFTAQDNEVQWVFLGKEQENIGTYTLKLVENSGLEDMRTVDVCNAFMLVSHSCAAKDSEDAENIITETVELSSEITPVIGGVGIGEPTASAESLPYGNEASVVVESSGPSAAKVFSFRFGIPVGKPGADGVNGVDGKDGHTPIVTAEKDTDGIYYWKVDGSWLLSNGAKVRAQGYDGAVGPEGDKGDTGPQGEQGPQGVQGPQGEKGEKGDKGDTGPQGEQGPQGNTGSSGTDGVDGITPKLKIENDYWYASYDNGATWQGVGPATSSEDLSDYATKEEVTKSLADKVDKVEGKGLSTEDFTTALKEKLNGLSNYNDTAINNAISALQQSLNTLLNGNPNDAINSFNEIIAFLDGVKDTQDLSGIIASIEQQIAGKLNKKGGLVSNVAIACDAEGNTSDSYVNEINNYAATLRLQKSSSQALALCQGGGKTRVYGPFEADKPAEFKDSLKAKSFINGDGIDLMNHFASKTEVGNAIASAIFTALNTEV